MKQPRTTEQLELFIGYDSWGRKLQLRGGQDAAGRWSWTLVQRPASFREPEVRIEGLTHQAIREIAAAVERDGR